MHRRAGTRQIRRVIWLLAAMVALGMGALPVLAQGTLTITGMSFISGATACSYVKVDISAVGSSVASVSLTVRRNGSSVYTSNIPPGSYSEYAPVNASPGDQITASASWNGLTANSGPLVCGGGGGGGGGGGASSGGSSAPGDGRLGYTPDEYYTLYCASDALEIWRGVPSGLRLETVSLAALLNLSVGASLGTPSGVDVGRVSDDGYEVRGATGNLAPAPGVKGFSMAECLGRNGGAPAAAATATPVPPPPTPEATRTFAEYCAGPGIADRLCYTSDLDWCVATNYSDTSCVNYNFFRWLGAVVESAFDCWMAIGMGLIGMVGSLRPWRWRQSRRKR